ncbi:MULTISPECIES: hypothetical protein [Lactiplantibacillus]|uniref:hypothetical protein n=1 Tax=Lactiplantibacillus TaxID=2767842 RepID=UPI001C1F4FCA|nr:MULTISPECIES: hypothetical protein [Lactiplantibacillus]MBU7449266.1 hypothetical protein [Lactiplantibacillus sp. 7.2.4]MBU7481695.1 hypothetical protein [Lactiplantibacillus pentosus]
MASELEKLDELQRKLNERKRKARTKEYQKLGRAFYQKSQAKTFAGAHQMLDHVPMFQQSAQKTNLTDAQMQQLIDIADHIHWNGNFWQIEDLKNVSQWLAQFRTDQDQN